MQNLIKLPFRAARAGFRLVRDVVAPVDAGAEAVREAPVGADAAPVVQAAPAPAAVVAPVQVVAPAPAAKVVHVPVAIRVEETPNPDARKFVCSRKLVDKGSLVFNDAASASGTPFAAAVFALDGIRTVFATRDFVTVTRASDGTSWRDLQPKIEAALRETLSVVA